MTDMYKKEESVIIGNVYNKYESQNPIVKILMKNFHKCLFELIEVSKAKSIYELGCGEGKLCNILSGKGYNIMGSDFSSQIIAEAKINFPELNFEVNDIYNITTDIRGFDLLLCSEVLEHLIVPEKALAEIKKKYEGYCLFTVPREPIWRFLNMCRGKYIRDLGNTPGHIQHWSDGTFVDLLKKNGFQIIRTSNPTPWTMALTKI